METIRDNETGDQIKKHRSEPARTLVTPEETGLPGPFESQPAGRSRPANVLVIRMWGEWSESGLQWRGRIEQLPGGRMEAFSTLEALSEAIFRFSRRPW